MVRRMELQDFQVIDQCLCVKLPEEIDHHHAEWICETTDRQIMQQKVTNVVFDFESTKFMDSSGVGMLIGRYRRISCFGGKVYCIHVDRQIKRMLYLSGVYRIIEIMD